MAVVQGIHEAAHLPLVPDVATLDLRQGDRALIDIAQQYLKLHPITPSAISHQCGRGRPSDAALSQRLRIFSEPSSRGRL